jgi:mono/diheme cytochrome c family protein
MNLSRALVLLACTGASTATLTACNEDLLNPMADRQPRVNAYGRSDFFDEGLAMRAPPVGTVPRQRLVGDVGLTTGKGPGPTGPYVTAIPVKVDDALMQVGRRRYDIFCATCHGPAGDGNSIVATQMALRPPPSLLPYADRPVGYIFDVITNGFGMMASYAAELPVRERWAVIAYLRALQVSQAAPLDRAPPEERARLEKETQ